MKLLHVLMVFESENEVYEYKKQLLKAGLNIESKVAVNEQDLIITLEEKCWDFILCGRTFYDLTAIDVLNIRNELAIPIPFIIISDEIPEDELDYAFGNGLTYFIEKDKVNELAHFVHRIMI